MMSSKKTKIAIIHPHLWWGGSEACALWAVEALKNDYDVTLIAGGRIRLPELNGYYGTRISPKEISIEEVPLPLLFQKVKGFYALRDYKLSRYCRKHAGRFDVMFSTYNPMDFGRPGIQYVLDPLFTGDLLKLCAGRQSGLKALLYHDSLLRKIYLWTARHLAGESREGFRRNITIVDSDWTARLTERALDVQAMTVYPPVPGAYSDREFTGRENGFVCLGRINYEKRIDKIIFIIKGLRERCGKDFHLHIIGNVGDKAYMKSLSPLIRENRDWLFMEGSLPDTEKTAILEKHKYGIHGRSHEPFGIAVAEMVKAGCLVWVPEGGGQTEIVGHPDLMYSGVEDAVFKISRILEDQISQNVLREHLRKRAGAFSIESYMMKIQAVISRFIEGTPSC